MRQEPEATATPRQGQSTTWPHAFAISPCHLLAFPSPAGLLLFTTPPLDYTHSLPVPTHFPLPSYSVPLPLCGLPPLSLSLSLCPASVHGVNLASLIAPSLHPHPTHSSLCSPFLLGKAGLLIHRGLTSAQCWLCPGVSEPNGGRHECHSGPSPALPPALHRSYSSESSPFSPHIQGRSRTNRQN